MQRSCVRESTACLKTWKKGGVDVAGSTQECHRTSGKRDGSS